MLRTNSLWEEKAKANLEQIMIFKLLLPLFHGKVLVTNTSHLNNCWVFFLKQHYIQKTLSVSSMDRSMFGSAAARPAVGKVEFGFLEICAAYISPSGISSCHLLCNEMAREGIDWEPRERAQGVFQVVLTFPWNPWTWLLLQESGLKGIVWPTINFFAYFFKIL